MDDADRAKLLEMAERERALQRTRARAAEREPPLIIDGVRHCLDCHCRIPDERLAARAESVRCVDCKALKERRERTCR